MSWLDLILLVVFLFHLISGYARGLVKQLFDIIGFFLVVLLSFWGSRSFSAHLAVLINPEDIVAHHDLIKSLGLEVAMEKVPQLVAGIILFLLFLLLLSIVFRFFSKGFRWVNKIPVIGFLNRLGGALLGALVGIILIYLIIVAIDLVPLQPFMGITESSQVAFVTKHYLAPLAQKLKELFAGLYLSA